MSKIKRLSDELIPKIAAGEVVERPGSVVKELLENSLDANPTELILEIENAGLKKIKIMDDGEGMDKSDLEKCFLPHTTSKISKLEHLNEIATLGFRGEALNSICAVSKALIKSKNVESEFGYEIEIAGGIAGKITPSTVATGTSIEIKDLFYNVPSRKKFVKSPQAEFKQIVTIVLRYALCQPKIKFKLTHNKKVILDLPKDQTQSARIKEILGKETFKNLLKVSAQNEYLKITGLVGKPQETGSSKEKSFLFVNGRSVENDTVTKAIKTAYGRLIENTQYPTTTLFLELMPSLVNVNIHPQKREVSFWNDETVFDFVKAAVEKSLEEYLNSYKTDYFGKELKASMHTYMTLKDSKNPWQVKMTETRENYEQIVQVGNTYIMSNVEEGLVLVDQHAAHESILFEEYLEEFEKKVKEKDVYHPKTAVVFELGVATARELEQNLENLRELGFEIEPFGKNTFKIESLPKIFKEHNLKNLIEELLDNLGKEREPDAKTKQTIEFLACRSAIKAGEKLTLEECKKLLKKLEESKGYLTCPHGRPTKIVLSFDDLERMFKRR